MNNKIDILSAKFWGTVDATICKKYSLKKAKQFIKIKAEIYMPKINDDTMQALFKFAKAKIQFNNAMENLTLALFKQRYDIPDENKLTEVNSCCENLNELDTQNEEVEHEQFND